MSTKKHGVLRVEDGTYEFYWLGNRVPLEEFNDQTYRLASSLGEELDGISMGMDLAATLSAAQIANAQIDMIHEILGLPLCERCRPLIG